MAGWQRQPALVRAVNAMMCALGGASVKLRIPAASDEGTQRELGIAPPVYREAELAPVMVRESESKSKVADRSVRTAQATQIEVLISSSALDALMPAFGVNDGASFLRLVRQIVYGSLVFAVTQVSEERFAGVTYLYRITAVSTQ
ncbi:MAG: hypothetical protein ACXVZV_15775 [Terriglobales bacterium]